MNQDEELRRLKAGYMLGDLTFAQFEHGLDLLFRRPGEWVLYQPSLPSPWEIDKLLVPLEAT